LLNLGWHLRGGILGHCAQRLAIFACLIIPAQLAAQLAPVGVPVGTVRVELDGSLDAFDHRFGAGNKEIYAADLSSPALGSDRIPELADAEGRIGRVIGNAGYRINLGGLSTDSHADIGSGYFGLSLGITNAITIFGRIPLVRTRVQSRLALDPATADAGVNPGQVAQASFFTQFDAALSTLTSKLAAGDYDADPTQRALAEATLADGTSLRSDLFGLLADPVTASSLIPTTTSGAGVALDARVAALQSTLTTNLAVPGFTTLPALPDETLTQTEFDQFLAIPLALRLNSDPVAYRGDAEGGAAITLIDHWDRGRNRGGFRMALSGLVRFPTGRVDRSDDPLDIGTGEGQTDIQLDLVSDLGAGALGARLTGTYVRQLPADFALRVTAPSQPFVGPERLTFVRRDPGDIVAVGVRPFYRMARTFAIQAGVDHWYRKSDVVGYSTPAGAIPGVDPSVLSQESSANATTLSLGVTYANPGGLRPGGTGLPVDASWSYERVLRAGGGRVQDIHAVRGRFRVYFRLW
jgi:hypothetical protein